MYYHCYDERKNNINEQLKCNCNKEMPYVFVSYSHQDSKEVHEIIKELYSAGYNVWFDEGIDPGTEWDEFIASSVKESSFFIAFLSKNYLYCQHPLFQSTYYTLMILHYRSLYCEHKH